MSLRFGLAVQHDALRLVALRGKRIAWSAETPREQHASLDEAVAVLLAGVRLPRWPRPRVSVAVGAPAAQVKIVGGLPAPSSMETLSAIVRENPATFFLRNGAPLRTARVMPLEPGTALAAAVEEPLFTALVGLGRERHWRLRMIVPLAAAVAPAITEPSFRWDDGDVTWEIVREGAALTAVRSRIRSEAPAVFPTLVPTLAALGEEAIRFAPAYGAALLDPRHPLSWTRDPADPTTLRSPWRTLRLPVIFATLGLAAIAAAPVRQLLRARQAEARAHAVTSTQWAQMTAALETLDQVTDRLRDAEAFVAAAPAMTTLLAQVTERLPRTSYLLSYQATGGTLQLGVVTAASPDSLRIAFASFPGARSVVIDATPTAPSLAGGSAPTVTLRIELAAP